MQFADSTANMDDEGGLSLSVAALHSMTPVFNGKDIVRLAARHLLLSCVKSEPRVRETFFPSHEPDSRYESHVQPAWFDFENFAWLYVCEAICEADDPFGIGAMLKREAIERAQRIVYRSPDWKRLGFALYTLVLPDILKDPCEHTSFRAYMDDTSGQWGSKLSSAVLSDGLSVRQHDVNTLCVKLHLLNPSTVMPVFDHLRKSMPGLHMEMATTNYLGRPLEPSLVLRAVSAAIDTVVYPSDRSRFSVRPLDVFYGVSVTEFVMETARERNVWSGAHPRNMRVSHFRDRCALM